MLVSADLSNKTFQIIDWLLPPCGMASAVFIQTFSRQDTMVLMKSATGLFTES